MITSGLLLERFDDQLKHGLPAELERNDDSAPERDDPAAAEAVLDPPPVNAPQRSQEESDAEAQEDEPSEGDERAALRTAISGLLATLTSDAERARRQMVAEMSTMVQESLRQLLPHLLDIGSAKEIADSVTDVLKANGGMTAKIALHPDQHEAIVDHLKALELPKPVEVQSSSEVAAGTAHIEWNHGGAVIDTSITLSKARAIVDARLEGMNAVTRQQNTPDGAEDE